ncbi:MAG: MFS transporter [Methylibium sp. NZG]|nr:MAG: MFS transporter [Methylibium sp. NZG]
MADAARVTRWSVALAGAVALAVAMGIGRFAFTPLLPMMLHDGVIDLQAASWLASVNYLGYLAGALLCTFQPWLWARLGRTKPLDGTTVLRAGLVATGVLTLAMALPAAALWPLWRFAAGVASALVFVFTSGWCLAQLARLNASAMGGVMYAGPGAGIVVSGLLASSMVALEWRAAAAWAVFGGLAWGLTAVAWRRFEAGATPSLVTTATVAATSPEPASRATTGSPPAGTAPHGATEIALLAFAYGLAGFGYIITATFLPVIARAALPGSPWLDLFWPLFGAAVMAGALLSTRLRLSRDLRWLLAVGYLVQATGVGLSVWWPTLTGFALSSVLLGLPFTAITFFAMQEVRRLRPAAVASTMGLLTAMYGIGQIVGPPLAAWLLLRSVDAGSGEAGGFTIALQVASGALLVGAAMYAGMIRTWPDVSKGSR